MKIPKLLLSLSSAILIALSTAGASDYEEPYATTVSKTDAQITINLMHVRYPSRHKFDPSWLLPSAFFRTLALLAFSKDLFYP